MIRGLAAVTIGAAGGVLILAAVGYFVLPRIEDLTL